MKQPVRHLRRLKPDGRVCSICTTKDIILDGKIAKTKNDHKIYGCFYQHSTVAPPIERLPDGTHRGAARQPRSHPPRHPHPPAVPAEATSQPRNVGRSQRVTIENGLPSVPSMNAVDGSSIVAGRQPNWSRDDACLALGRFGPTCRSGAMILQVGQLARLSLRSSVASEQSSAFASAMYHAS